MSSWLDEWEVGLMATSCLSYCVAPVRAPFSLGLPAGFEKRPFPAFRHRPTGPAWFRFATAIVGRAAVTWSPSAPVIHADPTAPPFSNTAGAGGLQRVGRLAAAETRILKCQRRRSSAPPQLSALLLFQRRPVNGSAICKRSHPA